LIPPQLFRVWSMDLNIQPSYFWYTLPQPHNLVCLDIYDVYVWKFYLYKCNRNPHCEPHKEKGVEEQWKGNRGLNKTLTTLYNINKGMWFVAVPLIILLSVPMAFCKLTHTMHMMSTSKCHYQHMQASLSLCMDYRLDGWC
jgi:hypothetical protein